MQLAGQRPCLLTLEYEYKVTLGQDYKEKHKLDSKQIWN